jgi:lipoprotein signal peptidase
LLTFTLAGALGFEHNTLELLKNWELLVSVVNFGIALTLADQKTNLFQALQLALDVTGVFFDELSQTPYMRPKIGVFSIYHDDFSTHPGSDKRI